MPTSKYSAGLEGRRFNRTVVVSFSHAVPTKHETRYYWNCLCDCGTRHAADARSMFRGMVQSCGCLGREKLELRTKHGHSTTKGRTPEAHSWKKMKARCYDLNNEWFHRYGGRGIKVCESLKNDFTAFLALLGPRPTGKTIDRTDNDGHYSCGACPECVKNDWPMNIRWATIDEQNSNKHNTVFLTVNSRRQALFLWAKEIGVTREALYQSYRRSELLALETIKSALSCVPASLEG